MPDGVNAVGLHEVATLPALCGRLPAAQLTPEAAEAANDSLFADDLQWSLQLELLSHAGKQTQALAHRHIIRACGARAMVGWQLVTALLACGN